MSPLPDTPVQTLHEGEFLRLLRHGHWEYVQRQTATGAAALIAVTDDDEIVLVEQYRIPVQAHTIELPAGVIGDSADVAGESALATARRELLEETGFDCAAVEPAFDGPSSPGLTSETSHLVRARGLTRVHAGGGVDGENITVHVVPLASVHPWLRAQQAAGKPVEPKVWAALYWLLHERGSGF
ncbi:NUDIX hydrolase [Flagellatimonas centrodinii]|uniref:NUDIX hydrolase n=1 Tax=Flagellatimonas centrodinii TaxID=2806210 RepID=UPI001FEE7168|nr:NUDIX hydrolase [Flagellatimonas centrodinii]ULQ47283.1 NUDIX hydrolase [Flagellatimonas centrodinii]